MGRRKVDGKRLRAGGGRTRNEDCCCCVCSAFYACLEVSGTAWVRDMEIDVAGVTNGSCAFGNCAAFLNNTIMPSASGVLNESLCLYSRNFGDTGSSVCAIGVHASRRIEFRICQEDKEDDYFRLIYLFNFPSSSLVWSANGAAARAAVRNLCRDEDVVLPYDAALTDATYCSISSSTATMRLL